MKTFDWFILIVSSWCILRGSLLPFLWSCTRDVELIRKLAPKAYDNWVSLNRKYFYFGLICMGILLWLHR